MRSRSLPGRAGNRIIRPMTDFTRIELLEAWLERRQVSVAEWGRGSSKSLAALWAELLSGESRLEGDPPRRIVSVVQMISRRGELVLVEAGQELEDGRQRGRWQLPSEKMHPEEEPEQAALRGLQEELGVAAEDVSIVAGSLESWQWERDSISYPGLRTCHCFRVEALLPPAARALQHAGVALARRAGAAPLGGVCRPNS